MSCARPVLHCFARDKSSREVVRLPGTTDSTWAHQRLGLDIESRKQFSNCPVGTLVLLEITVERGPAMRILDLFRGACGDQRFDHVEVKEPDRVVQSRF